MPDVAALAAALGTALHAAGLPVGPDRCERLSGALTVMNARSLADLHACALATLVSDPGQVVIFERVFALLVGEFRLELGQSAGLRRRPTGTAARRPLGRRRKTTHD